MSCVVCLYKTYVITTIEATLAPELAALSLLYLQLSPLGFPTWGSLGALWASISSSKPAVTAVDVPPFVRDVD